MTEFSKEVPPEQLGDPKPTKKIAGVAIMSVLGSFAKKIATVAAVYLLGYFQFSVAWFVGPIIFSVIRDEWRKEKELKRNIAKAAALVGEKEVILARVDDLPSWVFFPDIERAEWINRIIRQVWPNVNHYARGLIKDTIEPAVAESLASYKLNGFQFKKMNIGSIPPRVGGVKVYDPNISRNEILMDLDFFYAGDCDISFTLRGVSGGIKDFQIHGMIRVVMKPLITQMPMVGGLQVFFLNNPAIDFNLVGVADVLDMPGLSNLLRRVIVEQIANMMVLPNKLPIQLSEEVPPNVLKTPEPEGVLRINVIEARNLMKKDIGVLGKGKSDPYVILNVGAQEFKTSICYNEVNPVWNFCCESMIEDLGQLLNIIVNDYDNTGKDNKLGRATLEIRNVVRQGEVDTWIGLEEAKHGMIHLKLKWFWLSDDAQDLKNALEEVQTLKYVSVHCALLMIFVDSIKNLPNARPQSKPDPAVTMRLRRTTKTTVTRYRTDSPVYEQGFMFLVNNPEVDTIHLQVTDQKTNKDIGEFTYNISQLLDKPKMNIDNEPFRLQRSGPQSAIVLSMQLKVYKYGPNLRRQESIESADGGVIDSTVEEPDAIDEIDPSPIQKQGSIRSNKSVDMNVPSSLSKDLIKTEAESQRSSPPPPPKAPISRTGSVMSNASRSSSSDHNLGRILLSFTYHDSRQRLDVTVHKIANLPLNDPTNIPDPYVKLYLLPEKSKDSKRKTDVIKDNCNPIYEQTFEYLISPTDLSARQLEVSVATRKKLFSSQSNCMGQVLINLCELDLSKTITEWFDLLPEFHKDKDD